MSAPHQLPIIDLSVAEGLPQAIDEACRTYGFFYVVGHGVPASLRSAAFDAARRFFALDEATKTRWHIERSGIHRGFDPIGWQALEPGQPADLKESFYLGVDRQPDDPLVQAGTPNHGPNQWPDDTLVPGFKPAVEAYQAAMADLSARLLALMAEGLGLPSTHFEACPARPHARVAPAALPAATTRRGGAPRTDRLWRPHRLGHGDPAGPGRRRWPASASRRWPLV